MKCDAPLSNFLDERLASSIELLRQMVAINSFTANKDGVEQLGKFTAEVFSKLGFSADYTPSTRPDFARHLVLTRKGRTNKTIGLISHLDTVYPVEEEKRNNFNWRVEGDRIYGPGTMDIKGGTVMIHLVLDAIKQLHPNLFEDITWVILLNSSEEVYSYDFGQLCLQRLGGAIAALVFEAGVRSGDTYSLVTARKGRAVYRINVEGRGAHAGSHHDRGANAIVQLSETISQIAALTDYKKERTFNVATISGGTVINRVPHEAVAEGEMRCFSMEAFREGVGELMKLNGAGSVRAPEDNHPCSVSIKVIQESPPWPRNDGTEKLFQAFYATGKELGLTILREERGGLSDGNFICHAIPTIDGLGPNGDNAHCSEQSVDGSKQQEFVEVPSFVPKAALCVNTIVRLLNGK